MSCAVITMDLPVETVQLLIDINFFDFKRGIDGELTLGINSSLNDDIKPLIEKKYVRVDYRAKKNIYYHLTMLGQEYFKSCFYRAKVVDTIIDLVV